MFNIAIITKTCNILKVQKEFLALIRMLKHVKFNVIFIKPPNLLLADTHNLHSSTLHFTKNLGSEKNKANATSTEKSTSRYKTAQRLY